MADVSDKAISKRWNSRVIANGWQTNPMGADLYMEKYGKNISIEKIEALMYYARSRNCDNFYRGMLKHRDHLAMKLKAKEVAEKLF